MADISTQVEDFVIKLRRRQVRGSQVTAKKTTELLRQVISQQRLPQHLGQATALIDAVKSVGVRLIAGNPVELAVGNVVRRVLHIIREESAQLDGNSTADGASVTGGSETADGGMEKSTHSAAAEVAATRSTLRPPSLYMMLERGSAQGDSHIASADGEKESRVRGGDLKQPRTWQLKHNVIEGINELLAEIENFHSQVADQALEHIHQNEVILTIGRSRTLLEFLLEARKKRSFQVVVAEGAPRYEGHVLAKELSAAGLQTTAITDSAIYAMMARANMVVVAAHAVMANGGVIASVGLHTVALAARRHAVPFVVLAGLFKLCPVYPHNPTTVLNDLRSPSEVLDLGDSSDCLDESTGTTRVQVVNPTFDYIPPELISLFITDNGGHNPSYVYRLVAEYYSPEDFAL